MQLHRSSAVLALARATERLQTCTRCWTLIPVREFWSHYAQHVRERMRRNGNT